MFDRDGLESDGGASTKQEKYPSSAVAFEKV
jgi:hypothetical protein